LQDDIAHENEIAKLYFVTDDKKGTQSFRIHWMNKDMTFFPYQISSKPASIIHLMRVHILMACETV